MDVLEAGTDNLYIGYIDCLAILLRMIPFTILGSQYMNS